ncbi:hypothetical protein LTS18_010346 [Coniosporium uncinatum]|uniref:Uncharacterized protein n=1 Tax=Coniosporium uncinatum TaxID=93489 RepID=A0ACC3D9S6_9PEZI|nr:hypothetical protein LTS18_010346 [Coniosporium uncinatum]
MAVFLTPYIGDWMMGFAGAPAVMHALTESLTVSWPKYVGTLENQYNIDTHDVMEHDGFHGAITTASFTSVNTLSSPLEQDLRAAFQTIRKLTFDFLDIERSDAREARGLAPFLSFARSLDELDLTLSTDFLHHDPSGRRHRNAATVAAALTGFVERLEAKVDDDDGIHEELRYEACDYYSDMYYPRVGNGYDGDGKPELLDGEEYFDEADRFDLEYRTRRD